MKRQWYYTQLKKKREREREKYPERTNNKIELPILLDPEFKKEVIKYVN